MASRKISALKHWKSRDSWSCINLQPCFASIARLNCRKSLKPIPPDFGLVSLSQLNRWIFLSFPICYHQNRAHMDWSSSHSLTDNWKTPIVYVGMDCDTALISISFPALNCFSPFFLYNQCFFFFLELYNLCGSAVLCYPLWIK